MNNKYDMYQNKINKVFHNNKKIFMTSTGNNVRKNIDIRKKINELISDNSFIYRTKVNMLIGNNMVTKKIIGIVDDKVITIDNEYIPIDSIMDIYK